MRSFLQTRKSVLNSKQPTQDAAQRRCLKNSVLSAGRETPAAAQSLQSCPTLWDPIDGSPPGSPVPEILQTRTLEWVAISFSNAWKWKVKVKSLSNDPMDCSLPGSSIHGIFQARVLEWVAVAFSRETPSPGRTHRSKEFYAVTDLLPGISLLVMHSLVTETLIFRSWWLNPNSRAGLIH